MCLINIEKAVNVALSKFTDERWHCAESVMFGLLSGAEYKNPENYVTSMSGFNGGVGGTKNMCGALSGGIAAAGCLLGRYGSEMQSMDICSPLCGRCYLRFESHFSTSLCSVLTKDYVFTSPERRLNCINFIEFSVRSCGDEINKTLTENNIK